jgi:peroxiredoxin Q/BCP
MSSMPTVGAAAPPLAGPTDQEPFDAADHAGKLVVVYFYPKDMTKGCTVEAQDFRDQLAAFQEAGAVVVGVSRDPAKRHAKFRAKESLTFPLIADEDGAVTEAWGVWQEKSMYGRTYMGIVRSTFLIGRDGTIAHAWPKVRVKGHIDEVLRVVQAAG